MTTTTPFTSPFAGMARRLALAGAACALLVLGGCATGPNANPRDPFEPFNRQMMRINEGVDAVLLKPAATAYRQAIPPLVRTGVSNFFGNLSDVWSFVNSALQFKLQNAAENFMRVNVNTFFGLGGILDIASELNIERHREDFGQTLGRWGMPAGPYLVLPLLGPSTMRDALAFPIDRRGDLVHYLDPVSHRNGLYVLRLVDVRANLLRVGDVISGAALDKYTFTRDAHLQRRRAEIFEGGDAPPEPRSEADDPSPVAGTPEAVLGAPPETAGQPQPEPAR